MFPSADKTVGPNGLTFVVETHRQRVLIQIFLNLIFFYFKCKIGHFYFRSTINSITITLLAIILNYYQPHLLSPRIHLISASFKLITHFLSSLTCYQVKLLSGLTCFQNVCSPASLHINAHLLFKTSYYLNMLLLKLVVF